MTDRISLGKHLVAAALFAVVAAVLLWPTAGDPTHTTLGHPANDVWNHVWGYWWVWDALSQGQMPLHTDKLGWPEGGQLWFIDIFAVVLTAPVQALWGPVAAYNANLLLQLWVCGLGAYVLGHTVSRSWAGGLASGLAFATAPHLLAQIYNGISETLAAGWMPLAVALQVRFLRQPSLPGGALAGLGLGIAALANWYYGLFSGLIFAVLILYTLGLRLARRRKKLRVALLRPGDVGGVLLAALTLALVVAWPFWLFKQSMDVAGALVSRSQDFVWMSLLLHNMTDLLSFFVPGKWYSPDLKAVFDEDLIVVVYLGHVLLWPALAARWMMPRRLRHQATVWLLVSAGFLILTLGPFLYINGAYARAGDYWLPLPFLALFEWVPFFSRVSHAYRFVMGAYVALGVLLALCVRGAEARGLPGWVLVLVLGGGRVVESLVFSPAVFPLPTSTVAVHPAYQQLDRGAVLDLPVGVPVLARSQYLAAQMVHQRPIPYALNDPTPEFLARNRYGQYLLELERSRVATLPLDLPLVDVVLGREQLVQEGLVWIVVHRPLYPPYQLAKTTQFLDLTATPVFADQDLRIYRLDP